MLLGELLVFDSVITEEQLEIALHKQKKTVPKESLGKILINEGYIDPQLLKDFLKKQSLLTQKYLSYVLKKNSNDTSIQPCLQQLEDHLDKIIPKVQSAFKRFNLFTGITIIDLQHIWLLTIIYYIEFFYGLVLYNKKQLYVYDIITECQKYSLYHFSIEEELLAVLDINVEQHYKKHNIFKLDMVKMQNKLKTPAKNKESIEKKMLSEISEYLRDWYLTHIAIEDKKYVNFINKHADQKSLIIKQWVRRLQNKQLLKITRLQQKTYEAVINNPLPEQLIIKDS